ncbi:hypothetical protein PENSPDRAFT_695666, partial [Peniophora sp. CONT]
MPRVDPANYPADIPEGGFHIDADDVDDFRLPSGLDTDVFLFQEARTDGSLQWKIRENSCTASHTPSTAQLTAAAGFAKERRIRDQAAEIQSLQAQLAAAQTAAAPPAPVPRLNIRLGTPHTFTGISNDKGVYDPTPRDFVRNVRNYIFAQEKQTGVTLGDVERIMMISTFLDQSAAMWYEQEVKKAEKWEAERVNNPTL